VRPGGAHVMLESLKRPLRGLLFPVTLTFQRAGQLQAEVPVESPQAALGNATEQGERLCSVILEYASKPTESAR
jgi:copper(I)-binding protein